MASRAAARGGVLTAPLVKWVGGKTKLLKQLAPLLPVPADIHHYAEPFVGGGAMLLHVEFRWPAGLQKLFHLNANDTNADLISFYNTVASRPEGVADVACRYAAQHNTVVYRQARALFNAMRPFVGKSELWSRTTAVTHAGLFLYLNKCGFNGLYRVNERGEFNVAPNPEAKWKPKLGDLTADLSGAAKALNLCMFSSLPFDAFVDDQLAYSQGKIIDPATVFFFVDPPYLNDEQSGFTAYERDGWSTANLMMLSLCMAKVHESGGRFMMTHGDTELVRDLFDHPDYNLTEVTAQQTISTTATGRGTRKELVIRNYA